MPLAGSLTTVLLSFDLQTVSVFFARRSTARLRTIPRLHPAAKKMLTISSRSSKSASRAAWTNSGTSSAPWPPPAVPCRRSGLSLPRSNNLCLQSTRNRRSLLCAKSLLKPRKNATACTPKRPVQCALSRASMQAPRSSPNWAEHRPPTRRIRCRMTRSSICWCGARWVSCRLHKKSDPSSP